MGTAGQLLMSYGDIANGGPEWVSISATESVGVATTGALQSTGNAVGTGTWTYNSAVTPHTLTAGTSNVAAAIDGYTLLAGDRVLIKNQASALTNGVYVVSTIQATGVPIALSRDNDSDTMSKIASVPVFIDQGTTNGGSGWFNTNKTTDTLGTTAINYINTTTVSNATTLNSQAASYYADHIIPYTKSGTLTANLQGTLRYRVPWAATIIGTTAAVNTAPTGANIVLDVWKNGTTIYSTTANRPTIYATFQATQGTTPTPNTTALAAGDYLTVNVATVGSTVAGADLSVFIEIQRA